MAVRKHSNPYYNSIVSLMNECRRRRRDKTIKQERTEKFDEIRFALTSLRLLQWGWLKFRFIVAFSWEEKNGEHACQLKNECFYLSLFFHQGLCVSLE